MIAAVIAKDLIDEPARTIVAMAAVMGTLALLFLVLKRMARVAEVAGDASFSVHHPHPELIRKLLHVGMGLVVLTFPWVFDSVWPVVAMAGASAIALIAVKTLPSLRRATGSVIEGVGRESLGEVYYPISVGILWILSAGDWLLYVIPLLILTLADALAALIGVRYGKTRYQTWDGAKSVEGSIAFFAIAFLSVHVPLLLFTEVGRAETLWIAVILGLLAMLIEAISWKGLDNIYIPLGAFALLHLYLPMSAGALLLRVMVTVGLVVFVMGWRKRTTLDDSALVAAAFYGYAAWMVGGLLWLPAPLALFVAHCVLWPRRDGERCHHLPAVLAIVSTGLIWLLIFATSQWPGALYAYAVGFASHLAKIGVSELGVDPSLRRQRPWRRIAGYVAGSWVVAFLPTLFLGRFGTEAFVGTASAGDMLTLSIVALGCIVVAAIGFYRCLPLMYDPQPVPHRIDWVGGLLGLAASILAAGAAYYLV